MFYTRIGFTICFVFQNLEFTLPSSSASNSSSQQDPSKMSDDQLRSELDKLLDHNVAPQKEAMSNFVDVSLVACSFLFISLVPTCELLVSVFKNNLIDLFQNYIKTCKDGQPDNAFIKIVTTAVVKSCLRK